MVGNVHRDTFVLAGLFIVSCSDSISGPPFYGAPSSLEDVEFP